MSFQILLDPITSIFTYLLNSSFSTGVFTDLENYALLKLVLKAGKDRDEYSSFRPIYKTSLLIRVWKTACLKQLNNLNYLSKMPAL